MITAYSYIRCSTKKQEHGDTKRRQLEWSERICREKGFTLDDSLKLDDLGTSAFRGKNAAVGNLATFLEAVKRGRVSSGSVLLVESLDRLSRNHVNDAYLMFSSILAAGVKIITRTPEREYTQGDAGNLMSIIEPLILFAQAHDESQRKSMRIGEVWGAKKRKARDGTPHGHNGPAWCRLTESGYTLDPIDAETVRTLFRLAREGLGVWRISRRMQGGHTIGRSKRWSAAYVRKILRERAAVGEYQPTKFVDGRRLPDGETIKGYYPAAVTEAEWLAAQNAITSRRRSSGRPGHSEANLFTGMIKEAYTGAPLVLQASAPKGGTRHPYLITSKAIGTFVRYGDVEEAVLSAVSQLTPRDVANRPEEVDNRHARIGELIKERTALKHTLETLQARIADSTTPRDAIGPLIDTYGRTAVNHAALVREQESLEQEATTGRPEALAEEQTLIGQIRENPADEDLRRRAKAGLRQVVEEIRVHAQRIRRGCQVVHVQIFLCNGSTRYIRIVPDRKGVQPLDLSGTDFRVGTNPT